MDGKKLVVSSCITQDDHICLPGRLVGWAGGKAGRSPALPPGFLFPPSPQSPSTGETRFAPGGGLGGMGPAASSDYSIMRRIRAYTCPLLHTDIDLVFG